MSCDSPAGTDAPSRSNYGDRVIRRSFRIGLTLGLLGGLAFALVKMLGGRPSSQTDVASVPTDPWPRLTVDPATPVAPSTPPQPAPAVVAPDVAPVAAPVAAPIPNPTPPGAAKATKKAPKAAKGANGAKKATKGTKAAKKATKAAKKTAAPRKKALTSWVAPTGDVCPTSHPVKAKLASKIFHLPGMLNYERTKPDRCYLDGASAEADGLRVAKR